MSYIRVGNEFRVFLPDEATADQIEILLLTWQPPELVNDLGNLDAYNVQRAALKAKHDFFQEQINAVDTATDPDARTKIDAAMADRDHIAVLLRKTARPEPAV
jgi:hypothetical protein